MVPFLAQFDLDLVPRDAVPPALDDIVGGDPSEPVALHALELLNSYAHIFVAAFAVTLLATPIVRRIAIAGGVIDVPDAGRKQHPYPVAYLGGVAVFLGLFVAIAMSWFAGETLSGGYKQVPFAIMVGMVAIMVTGLADDVWGWDPRLKIAGQLVAAAALAINDVGVHVAAGMLTPIMGAADEVLFSIWDFRVVNGHLYYWLGTALIAIFVLGGCNSANLLDGLDGLLGGVVAIIAVGLLAICLLILPQDRVAAESTRAEAEAAGEVIAVQVERYRAAEQAWPPSLNALVREGYLEDVPPLPLGWSMRYVPARGEIDLTDERDEEAHRVAAEVHDQVRLYHDREGELPEDLGALVRDGSLAAPPQETMPDGWFLRYDANSGQVTPQGEVSPLGGARIVLCIALLGAVLGFLPHNFRPASIFLGDCGSLLLGYLCVVIILMLGDRGKTPYVFAGLIVFSVPIIDTTLAILRRLLAGTPLSAGDNQHLHHQLMRALGSVGKAVFALYGISAIFATVGVLLVVLVLHDIRARVIYTVALVLFSFIAVIAVKEAQRKKLQSAAARAIAKPAATPAPAKAAPALEDPEAAPPDAGGAKPTTTSA